MDIKIELIDDKWNGGEGSAGQLLDEFASGRTDMGGICSFSGLVRDFNDDGVVQMLSLEHYPAMAEKKLQAIAEQAYERWGLQKLWIIHRYGDLLPGDTIVVVLAGAVHRAAAFDACRFVMDYLKVEAPFWKVEKTPDGDMRVTERTEDHESLKKWKRSKWD